MQKTKQLLEDINNYISLHVCEDREASTLMETMCREIGPRPSGSPEIKQAHEYLKTRLEAMGAVNIRQEEVGVRRWYPGKSTLELLEPVRETYDCLQCLYTASQELTAPLVAVGNGTPADFEEPGQDVRNAVVLMNGYVISGGKFTPLIARITQAYEKGARAIILRKMDPIALPSVEAPDFRENSNVPIPCICVSDKVADKLVAMARGGNTKVRIRANGYSEPCSCANLIADMGTDNALEEMIILGAHLDSFWNAPGALDNLSGVVTVFEIARLLSPFQSDFKRGLRVIAYTGEETGFLGSKSYVSRHRDELDKVNFVINIDSIFPSTARGMAVMWSPEMRDYIAHVFDKTGQQVDVRNHFCCSSDYLPFMLEGIPAARPADWENSFPTGSHTAKDDLGNVSLDWIRINAMVYARLLAHMLIDPHALPLKCLTKSEVREKVREEDVAENLKLLGFNI